MTWAGAIASLAPLVHFPNVGSGLEPRFGLCIDRLFDHLLPAVKFSTPLLYLGLYGGLETFSEKPDQVGLFWSPVSIKLQ